MDLAWFIPGVVLLAVGALSVAQAAFLMNNKPNLRFWVALGAYGSMISGAIILLNDGAKDAVGIVMVSVLAILLIELLIFEHLRKKKAPAQEQTASKEADSSEDSPEEGLLDELPDENELVVGREYAIRTEGKRAVGVLKVMTPTRLLLVDSVRGWYVVIRDQITGYGSKDS